MRAWSPLSAASEPPRMRTETVAQLLRHEACRQRALRGISQQHSLPARRDSPCRAQAVSWTRRVLHSFRVERCRRVDFGVRVSAMQSVVAYRTAVRPERVALRVSSARCALSTNRSASGRSSRQRVPPARLVPTCTTREQLRARGKSLRRSPFLPQGLIDLALPAADHFGAADAKNDPWKPRVSGAAKATSQAPTKRPCSLAVPEQRLRKTSNRSHSKCLARSEHD
jgi:hypothetical protein